MTRGRAVLCLLAGGALSLAFPEPDIAPLAWIAIAPLLVASMGERTRTGAAYGFLFGLGFFGTLLIWISIVGYVAWGVLVLLQASFVALFAALYARTGTGWVARVIGAPVLWVAVDLLRANVPVGGFTWGQLAQSQHSLPWMLRPAALGGGWLVAFVVVAANALVAEAWRRRLHAAAWALGAVLVLGVPLLLPANTRGGDPIRVAIVQGSVPRDFSGTFTEKNRVILDEHVRLTQALDPEAVDLVVWPESAIGIDLERDVEVGLRVADAARAVGAPLVVGGNLDTDDGRYLVMAFEVSPEGGIVDRYQKTHLVPFGEYVPGRGALGWIPMLDQVPRDAVPGGEHTVFDVAGGKVAPVISFEGDFGSLVRRPIARGGRLLVIATNTSTWEDSWASAQHVAFGKVRAVENGVWVVHAAISGISAFIAPDGVVEASLPLWTAGSMVRTVAFADDITFYARTGDWFAYLCAGAAVVLVGAGIVRRQRGDSVSG